MDTSSDNITYCTNLIKNDNYNWVLYIDLDKTSDNIKNTLKDNIIKLNINYKFKYIVIDKFGNKKLEYFSNINLINKYLYLNIVYDETYSNYKISKLVVYDYVDDYKPRIAKSKAKVIKSIIN